MLNSWVSEFIIACNLSENLYVYSAPGVPCLVDTCAILDFYIIIIIIIIIIKLIGLSIGGILTHWPLTVLNRAAGFFVCLLEYPRSQRRKGSLVERRYLILFIIHYFMKYRKATSRWGLHNNWFGLSTQINCHQGHGATYSWGWNRVNPPSWSIRMYMCCVGIRIIHYTRSLACIAFPSKFFLRSIYGKKYLAQGHKRHEQESNAHFLLTTLEFEFDLKNNSLIHPLLTCFGLFLNTVSTSFSQVIDLAIKGDRVKTWFIWSGIT